LDPKNPQERSLKTLHFLKLFLHLEPTYQYCIIHQYSNKMKFMFHPLYTLLKN
jgi:hypothetical protein